MASLRYRATKGTVYPFSNKEMVVATEGSGNPVSWAICEIFTASMADILTEREERIKASVPRPRRGAGLITGSQSDPAAASRGAAGPTARLQDSGVSLRRAAIRKPEMLVGGTGLSLRPGKQPAGDKATPTKKGRPGRSLSPLRAHHRIPAGTAQFSRTKG
jgi:hypothetical protein